MPPTLTEPGTEAEQIARGIQAKGRGWKSRDLTVELRELAEGETADNRIPVRLSSEAPVRRFDWWTLEEYIEVLDHAKADLSYARDGLPFCLDHWTSKQIGLIEDVKVVGKELHGMVQFGYHPDAEWVEKDIRAGIRKKVSLGYIQGEYTSEKRKGDEPEERRYAFMAIEGSSVCIPADYEMGFGRSWLRALRSEQDNIPVTAHKAKETPMADNGIEAPDAGAEAREAEQLRVQSLRGLVDSVGADPTDVLDAIGKGTGVREFLRQQATKEAERANAATRGITTGAAPDVFVRSPKGAIGRDGQVKQDADTGGFESAGEFYQAVRQFNTRGVLDPRIQARAASGQSEMIDSDGGVLAPTAVVSQIIEPAYTTGQILSRVDTMNIAGPSLEQNMIDETSRVKGSRHGAVTHEWPGGETNDAATTSKIKFRKHRWAVNPLVLKGFVTDDELEDVPAMESTLTKAFNTEAVFAAEDAILNGDGNGKPLGIHAHPCLVSVAIEATQDIATTAAFIAKNVAKIKSRIPADLWQRGVWLAHSDIEVQLITATLGGTSAAMPIYMPPGGLSAAPYGTVLGRPMIFTEYNSAQGTVGDLGFYVLDQYRFVSRTAGSTLTKSAHVRFWENEMAFKVRWRVDGAPLWKQAVTPAKGSSTKSPFAVLAARS